MKNELRKFQAVSLAFSDILGRLVADPKLAKQLKESLDEINSIDEVISLAQKKLNDANKEADRVRFVANELEVLKAENLARSKSLDEGQKKLAKEVYDFRNECKKSNDELIALNEKAVAIKQEAEALAQEASRIKEESLVKIAEADKALAEAKVIKEEYEVKRSKLKAIL